MDDDQRDSDKLFKLVPAQETGKARHPVTLDVLKSAYIAQGLSVAQIAERYFLSESQVQKIVDDAKLPELRRAYIREGLSKIQNEQVNQAQRLLDVELNFKRLRIVQLEKQLEDFLAYYARHGDFCKRHPVSGEILRDTDGIPMQIHVPNVAREIAQLKESVTLSDGLKQLLTELDEIINGKPKGEAVGDDANIVEMEELDGLFRKKV